MTELADLVRFKSLIQIYFFFLYPAILHMVVGEVDGTSVIACANGEMLCIMTRLRLGKG